MWITPRPSSEKKRHSCSLSSIPVALSQVGLSCAMLHANIPQFFAARDTALSRSNAMAPNTKGSARDATKSSIFKRETGSNASCSASTRRSLVVVGVGCMIVDCGSVNVIGVDDGRLASVDRVVSTEDDPDVGPARYTAWSCSFRAFSNLNLYAAIVVLTTTAGDSITNCCHQQSA